MKLTDFIKLVPPSARGMFGRSFWSASIGQAECKGASSDDAVNGLKKTIETAFEGDYSPTVIPIGEHIGIVWRTPYGWKYSILDSGQDYEPHGSTLYSTRQEALATMRHQAACMEV